MAFLKRINQGELVFDIAIAVTAPLLYRLMVLGDGPAGPLLATPRFFFFILYIFVPFYLSVIVHGFNRLLEGSRILRGFFIAFSSLTVFTFYYSLFMDAVPAMDRMGIVRGPHLWWYLAGLLSILFGTVTGSVDFTGRTGPEPTPVHMVLIVVMIFATVVAAIVTVMTSSKSASLTWTAGVFLFLGGLVVTALVITGIFLGAAIVVDDYADEKWFAAAGAAGRRLVLPLVAGVVLSVWETVTLSSAGPGPMRVLAALTLGGTVPLRILMALEPPWRPINTVIALIAFSFHIAAISGLLFA